MEQKDKQLLLKDLCARLPYGVKCYNINTETDCVLEDVADISSGYPTFDYGFGDLESIKPYLRPMSSMTKEEQKEFVEFHCVKLCPIIMDTCLTIENEGNMFDWLNAHHFDYRGLIEKGLAVEAPEGMYTT